MESDEIGARVKAKIAGQWSRSNAHRVDLAKSLLAPERIRCRALGTRSQAEELELWLVVTEIPGSRDGYLIVCDESADQFGLATGTAEGDIAFLGWYGGFWDAFESM
jgi:hypothetical protein